VLHLSSHPPSDRLADRLRVSPKVWGDKLLTKEYWMGIL
jgi:hypothetical protein